MDNLHLQHCTLELRITHHFAPFGFQILILQSFRHRTILFAGGNIYSYMGSLLPTCSVEKHALKYTLELHPSTH